jgi:hypothetical protein
MPALSYATSSVSVETRVDDDTQRIYVTIRGPARGSQVSPIISKMFLARPGLTAFDMLYDLMEYTGDVEAEHIKPIADAYEACRPDPSTCCRTAFMTPDPNFAFWAEAMNFQFAGREHRVFQDRARAEAFLDAPRQAKVA